MPSRKEGKGPQTSAHPLLPPPPRLTHSLFINLESLLSRLLQTLDHLTHRLLIYLPFFPSPPPPEQPPSSEDPADAWFNAAGILLSLKHAAAERSARMGAPLEVVQWTPPGSDPSITQQQVCNLFAQE